jgi:hypothetical protein
MIQYFYSDGQPIDSSMEGVKRYKFNDESPAITLDLNRFVVPGSTN